MAARAKVVVTGIGSIDRKLRALPLKVQKRVANQSIRAGMKLVAKAVKQLVPILSGVTKANIVVRAGLRRKRGQVSIDARIDANAETKRTSKKTGKTVFYPAVVEYLYDDFMLRAFRSAGDAARRLTVRLLKAGVEREAKGR
jgi:hypothetical protein